MLSSEAALTQLVEQWSNGTLPPQDWTHAAHVATCSYLVWHNTLAQAYQLMKDGLYRFNAATGTPNSDERGYHETLTRFWVTLLFFEVHRGHFSSCLQATNGMLAKYGSSSRAEQSYYSFDVLRSKPARRGWIAPDVRCTVALEAFRW